MENSVTLTAMMKKTLWVIAFVFGSISHLWAQEKTIDTTEYIQNTFVEALLKDNDSLRITFNKTKEKLTKEQIENIFSKTKNKEYDIKKTRIALELTSLLGDQWSFDEHTDPNDRLQFKSVEEFKKFRDSQVKSRSAEKDRFGNLIRLVISYQNGSKVILEKGKNKNYIRTTIDVNCIEKKDSIEDISRYQNLQIGHDKH